MLIDDIFEDFGFLRKNVWRVRDGKVDHREVAAIAPSKDVKPRTRVETTEEKRDA